VDVDPVSYTMDVAQAEAAIGPRTKAIMPVHLYGNPADLPALADLAERRGIALVEDACQAHGAAYAGRACGAWGTGAFSFYPTKNMTTGEGGMITTADPQLADRSRLLREHGMRVRYHHDVYGFNFRMTDIHASIGLAQLRKLPAYNARRREIASRYTAALRGVITPQVRPEARHVFHQYTIVVRERDRFASMLAERGIGTAIYYPIPVHRQKSYLALGYGDQRLPITERLTEEILSIPVHPALTDAEVDTVIEAVNEVAAALGPVAAETSAIG
jgi:perosamine synthetase